MSGHKNFRILRQELDKKLQSDPEARLHGEQYRRAIRDALAVAALQESCGLSPMEHAGAEGDFEPGMFQIETSDDLYLSTLRSYVTAMGGRFELTAVFPDRAILLTPPDAGAQAGSTPAAEQPPA